MPGRALGREEVFSVNKYETIFIVNTEVGEETIQKTIEKFKGIIEASATVESVEEWGNKKLAYAIQYKTDGYYVLVNFEAEPEFIRQLENAFKIDETILKYIVVNKEK